MVRVKAKLVNMKEKEQFFNGMLNMQILIGTGQDQQLQPSLITEIIY